VPVTVVRGTHTIHLDVTLAHGTPTVP
jgi:hypothetical protein